jgi:hypothetical protein
MRKRMGEEEPVTWGALVLGDSGSGDPIKVSIHPLIVGGVVRLANLQ